jgi:hypothetical protein
MGKSIEDLFNNLDTFQDIIDSLPTKVQNAPNFLEALSIGHQRIMGMFKVLQDIYILNDLQRCYGVSLDYRGAEEGAPRGNYNDVDYRVFIQLTSAINRLNGGTIPEIRKILSIIFGDVYTQIEVIDLKDGNIKIIIPSTYSSDILSTSGSDMSAAGINLIFEIVASFDIGLSFVPAKDGVKDRDDAPAKLRLHKKLTSGRKLSKYASRIDLGISPIDNN